MPNANYQRGRRAEYRTQRILEAAGYETTRAAGSHGCADVIGWDSRRVRFIQVKCSIRATVITSMEREALAMMVCPPNATVELWTFRPRCATPVIEVL